MVELRREKKKRKKRLSDRVDGRQNNEKLQVRIKRGK